MGKILSKPLARKLTKVSPFQHTLEAVEALPEEEFELVCEICDIVKKRRIEAGRARLAASMKKADEEFKSGKLKPMTAEELLRSLDDD